MRVYIYIYACVYACAYLCMRIYIKHAFNKHICAYLYMYMHDIPSTQSVAGVCVLITDFAPWLLWMAASTLCLSGKRNSPESLTRLENPGNP